MALTSKQQVFIHEYLQCWNAAEAARLAGYSEHTARQQGSRLLTKVDVKAAIDSRIAELKMSADEVLIRLAEQARGSMADFVIPEQDAISLLKGEQAGKLHLVKKFTHTVGEKSESVSLELYDAQAALALIGKHHRLFSENIDVTSGGKPVHVQIYIPDNGRG